MSVQLAILGFLLERNYHGYELKKTISQKMGKWTDIKFGSIYHALGVLEKAGYVEVVETSATSGRPARSVYGITAQGQGKFVELLKDNLLNLQRIYLKDDIGVYFGSRLSADQFASILAVRIQLIEKILDELSEHRANMEQYAKEKVGIVRQLITRHIMHLKADIEWYKGLSKTSK